MNCAPGFAELARLPDADKTALFAAVEPSVLGPAMWLAPEEIYRRCEPFLPSEVQEFVDRERAFQGRIPKRYHPRSEDGLPGLESIDDLLLLTEREIQMTMREVTSAELALVVGKDLKLGG